MHIIELLFSYNGNSNAMFLDSVAGKDIEAASYALSKGWLKSADINITLDGNTALHFAVANNDIDMAKFLIENKIDIDAKNDAGNTALGLAVVNKDIDMSKLLVEKGATIDPTLLGTMISTFKAPVIEEKTEGKIEEAKLEFEEANNEQNYYDFLPNNSNELVDDIYVYEE